MHRLARQDVTKRYERMKTDDIVTPILRVPVGRDCMSQQALDSMECMLDMSRAFLQEARATLSYNQDAICGKEIAYMLHVMLERAPWALG